MAPRCWRQIKVASGAQRDPRRSGAAQRASGRDDLREVSDLAHRSGIIPGSATGRQLSAATMGELPRDLAIPGVPHGVRSTYRNWCAQTGAPPEVAEAALGHPVCGVGAPAGEVICSKRGAS